MAKVAKDRKYVSSWRAIVLTRVDALEAETAALPERARRDHAATIGEIARLLDNARQAAAAKVPWMRSWLSGGSIERAWRSIHSAEVLLAAFERVEDIRVRYPDVVACGRQILPKSDQRREAIELWLAEGPGDADLATERARFEASLRWVNTESDNAQARVRSFRNVLIAVTVAMAVVALTVVIIGSLAPKTFPICVAERTAEDPTVVTQQGAVQPVCPTGRRTPSGGDVPLVAFVGVIGASLASAVAIRKIHGTSTHYSVPLALAVLKLPTGALTAVAGLILIQGEFLPGLSALDNAAQVLAYAILLGYGQELFTRLVDRQGQTLLNSAPGPDPLTKLRDDQLPHATPVPPPASPPPGGWTPPTGGSPDIVLDTTDGDEAEVGAAVSALRSAGRARRRRSPTRRARRRFRRSRPGARLR